MAIRKSHKAKPYTIPPARCKKPTSARPLRKLSPITSSPKSSKPSKTFTLPTAKRLKSSTKRSLKSLLPFISREWRLCVPISSLKTSRRSTKNSKPNPICSPRSTNLKSLLSISKPSSPPSPM